MQNPNFRCGFDSLACQGLHGKRPCARPADSPKTMVQTRLRRVKIDGVAVKQLQEQHTVAEGIC